MVASELDPDAESRFDSIQRKIDKLDKPQNRFNPAKPHEHFEITRVNIGNAARRLKMAFFLDAPARPQSLPAEMRRAAQNPGYAEPNESESATDAAADEAALARLLEAYDMGNGLFFDLSNA